MKDIIKHLYKNILMSGHDSKLRQDKNIIEIDRMYGTWRRALIKYTINKKEIKKNDDIQYRLI